MRVFSSLSRGVVPVILLVAFGLAPQNTSAQLYDARTDVVPQAYPGVIPCPSSGGCSSGGALTGQSYCFTPTDFATPICRATDQNAGGSQRNFEVDCGGSAEVNVMDSTDTRFTVCDAGGVPLAVSFNPSTNGIATLYPTQGPDSDGALGGCSSTATYMDSVTPFFSFKQPYIGYAESFLSNGDPAICQWNFASATTMPTYSNGGVTPVVDLAKCVSAMAGLGYGNAYVDDVTVSADDQTFAALGSTTPGQGSTGAVYVIVWNRTNGCRVWRTDTGAVTGAWGTTGTISLTDKFYLHNVRLSKNGNYLKVTQNTCFTTPGSCTSLTNTYVWDISTLTVSRIVNDSTAGCGHNAIGWLNTINNCFGGGATTLFWTRPFSSNDQNGTSTTSTYPSPFTNQDSHPGYGNGNATDTNPVLQSLYTGSFAVTNAWDNEILGLRLDGSGTVYRFAHTYATGHDAQMFGAEFAIGNVSADGRYYLWSTDWDGMLGQIGGGSSSCKIGTNCRADVFIALLPLATSIVPSPPTSLRVVSIN